MANLFSISFWGKYVNPTMTDHACDLCPQVVEQGSRAHYVNGHINEEYVAGWQHVSCWEKFILTGESGLKASIPLQIAKTLEPRP
jgi:hypothetical protein